MRHMRKTHLSIGGSKDKQNLINYGYFHGYKAYRILYNNGKAENLPFLSFKEMVATMQYDADLKSLLFGKLVFLETAIKNITLIAIMDETKSDSLNAVFDKAIEDYRDCPKEMDERKKKYIQQRKNDLRLRIYGRLQESYDHCNKKIVHFFHSPKHDYVPLWAIFDIMMMGDLDFFLQGLKLPIRKKINKALKISSATDTDFRFVGKSITCLRYLRNAIAHNEVIYDVRFRENEAAKNYKNWLKTESGFEEISMAKLTDYIALICIILRRLSVTKTEVNAFLKEYRRITQSYITKVRKEISSLVVPPNWSTDIDHLMKHR